ncbi:TetR family transcriptional regulator [Streptomyces diastatochromogenes]|nr:TetR family transcriptional regulator [Streptomyces diastatochromogenes]
MADRTPAGQGDEIYSAVLDLLREVGYDALTLDAVAAGARVDRDTLRRRWEQAAAGGRGSASP